MLEKIKRFPFHPILLALYAPLALMAYNLGQIDFSAAYSSILLTAIISSALLLVFYFLLKNWQIAGIVESILLVLFFTYGRVYTVIENYEVAGFVIGRHRYLSLIWLAFAVLGSWWAIKRSRRIPVLTSSLNVACFFLLLFPLVQSASFALSAQNQKQQLVEVHATESRYKFTPPEGRTLPDVYYIILDAYGRSDILLKDVAYDNSSFLNGLRELGFYVADCSMSNYSKTDLSLSSTLNMNYLSALGKSFTPESKDRLPLWQLVKSNQVKATFKDLGYTTIAFDTGFDFTQLTDSDIYYSVDYSGFNNFENLYLRTTFFSLLDDFGLFRKYHLTPEDRKRELILAQLDQLGKIPQIPGPKFVFAHIVSPHQPFVFGPNGESLIIPEKINKGQTYYTVEDYARGYHNQAIFISNQILEIVTKILRESPQPPVIIIQGDHGPSHFDKPDRMAILNAYYFPLAKPAFYPGVTPVNSFRLFFDTYMGAKLDLLPDVSNYSEYPYAYQFQEIPNQCVSGLK